METNLNCFKPLMSCNECQEFSHTLTYTKNNLVLYLTFLLLLNFEKSSWNIKLFGSNWHMDDIGAMKPLKLLKSKLLPETSLKKSVHKNFANFTEKHLCWSFFLNKTSVKFAKFLGTPLLKNIYERLLLHCIQKQPPEVFSKKRCS